MTATTLPLPTVEPTPESQRVAELQQMIRSGRYAGYLDELKGELAKAKAARNEIATLGVASAWEV
jgi:hypothetical protein